MYPTAHETIHQVKNVFRKKLPFQISLLISVGLLIALTIGFASAVLPVKETAALSYPQVQQIQAAPIIPDLSIKPHETTKLVSPSLVQGRDIVKSVNPPLMNQANNLNQQQIAWVQSVNSTKNNYSGTNDRGPGYGTGYKNWVVHFISQPEGAVTITPAILTFSKDTAYSVKFTPNSGFYINTIVDLTNNWVGPRVYGPYDTTPKIITQAFSAGDFYNARDSTWFMVYAKECPVATSVTPALGKLGRTLRLTVKGINIDTAGMTAWLENLSGYTIPADGDGTVIDAKTFTIQFTIPADAPIGKYKIGVHDSKGGYSYKQNCFTVTK